ncbi:tetraspanin-17-like [Diadema antillarum]|uniref:tetraspanin-17-like n=1 Tax=Diadema antillarum TaxID=105358 RepID=UPI003A850C9C
MADYYGNPPPYSTNPPPQSHAYVPSAGPMYYDDYPGPHAAAGYGAPPPQPAASAPPITPTSSVQRPTSGVPQQQQNRGRPKNKRGSKSHSQAPPPQQQARPKMQRANSAPSEISLCTKYCLFFANFVFWLAGGGLIGIGIWAWLDRDFFSNLDELSTSWYVDPVLWFTIIGAVILIMATFGCIGALRENICLLKTYSTVLGLMLLTEIGGAVAIYFYRNTILNFVTDKLDEFTIKNYRENEDFQGIIDGLQSGLKCCGVNDYNDWDNNIYFNCTQATSRYNPEACGVPFSCCLPDPADTSGVINTQCGYNVRDPSKRDDLSTKIYTRGCIGAFQSWLSTNLVVVAVGAGAILLVQIFGFCFATSLTSDIKRQMARWRRH